MRIDLFRFILEPPPEINISPEMPVYECMMRSATKLLRLKMRRVARLDIVLPRSTLFAVTIPLGRDRTETAIASLSIRTSSHMGQQRIRLPNNAPGQLMHGKKSFSRGWTSCIRDCCTVHTGSYLGGGTFCRTH